MLLNANQAPRAAPIAKAITHSALCPSTRPLYRCGQRRGQRANLVRINADASFQLSIADTTVAFPLARDKAQGLDQALQSVFQTFSAKQAAERPKRWQSMEYKVRGQAGQDELDILELFCNPNAHSTAFDAKVLVTLRTFGGVKVTTECRLTSLKAAVDAYLK